MSIIGTTINWGDDQPVEIPASERRRHVYVIGQTGTGKSTLLRNLILQDIDEGRGVGFIDPHGGEVSTPGSVSSDESLSPFQPQVLTAGGAPSSPTRLHEDPIPFDGRGAKRSVPAVSPDLAVSSV
jgi:GTPase SAR1 family protein